jgi:hypothetical protein
MAHMTNGKTIMTEGSRGINKKFPKKFLKGMLGFEVT